MKRVLVALDGSAAQAEVLAAAIVLARSQGSRLVLFHAVSMPTALPQEALSVAPDQVPDLLSKRAEAELTRLAETVPATLLESARVEVGSPWHAVVNAADRDAVDLIVIGAHGHGGIDRLLGTTAAKIVDHAKCSVLVVRGAHV
jgi:nucleotide-binding universal stress UspA family protein